MFDQVLYLFLTSCSDRESLPAVTFQACFPFWSLFNSRSCIVVLHPPSMGDSKGLMILGIGSEICNVGSELWAYSPRCASRRTSRYGQSGRFRHAVWWWSCEMLQRRRNMRELRIGEVFHHGVVVGKFIIGKFDSINVGPGGWRESFLWLEAIWLIPCSGTEQWCRFEVGDQSWWKDGHSPMRK